MCGIVGYLGRKDAWPLLFNGLKRLEYRGYDSAGIALIDYIENQKSRLHIFKTEGNVHLLEEDYKNSFHPLPEAQKRVGIGHSRWATHGGPSYLNAHPHVSSSGRLIMVHNGIIENYTELKHRLPSSYESSIKSETDSEILLHYIENLYLTEQNSLFNTVLHALKEVEGSYAIAIMDRENPSDLVVARNGSPLVIGKAYDENRGEFEFFVGSDASPFIDHTDQVHYLKEKQVALLNAKEILIKNLDGSLVDPVFVKSDLKLEEIEKDGFAHFMLKEIFEQPVSIQNALRSRILKDGSLNLPELDPFLSQLKKAKSIKILGCGTSWHAAILASYLFEELAGVNASVDYASEFRYRNPIIEKDDLVIGISQSGETADTIAALKLAKEKGAQVLSICNVIGSTIPRMSDAILYTYAGPEISVASTKAFTTQVTVLNLLALYIGKVKGLIDDEKLKNYTQALLEIPEKLKEVLDQSESIHEMSQEIYTAKSALFLGRGLDFPVALEGALKLKEISYIHAEGYPAAEMKHGPIALIEKNFPVIFIGTQPQNFDKILSNIQEVKARKGKVLLFTSDVKRFEGIADNILRIPETYPYFMPLLSVTALQLLSYHTAILNDCNVDQPRNLAKSVTVE